MFNVSLDIPQGGACYRGDARMFNVYCLLFNVKSCGVRRANTWLYPFSDKSPW